MIKRMHYDVVKVRELSDARGVQLQAATIAEYWAKRGRKVRVEVVECCNLAQRNESKVSRIWGVRSDMINGRPRA